MQTVFSSIIDPPNALAVDGSPLQMDRPVTVPTQRPMNSNKVDPKAAENTLTIIQSVKDAEFPICKAVATTSSTVFTKHFVIKFDRETSLYEYSIKGIPDQVSKRTARILFEGMLDAISGLMSKKDKFATDYQNTLVSWEDLGSGNAGPIDIRSSDYDSFLSMRFEKVGTIDIGLLERYVVGKEVPDEVS